MTSVAPLSRVNRFSSRIFDRLKNLASWLDDNCVITLVVLTVIYSGISIKASHGKFIAHDELFTYYIAQAPSLRLMMRDIFTIDLNPPLQYLLTRMSLHLFGHNELALRLPSFMGFFVGWLALFTYVRRECSTGWAVATVLLFWTTSALPYAWEARPYSLLLGFVCCLVLVWSSAAAQPRKPWIVPGLFLLSVGLFATHMLALFASMPFFAAQAVRSYRTRRLDLPVWVALTAPVSICLFFLRLTSRYGKYIYPPSVIPGPGVFYTYYLSYMNSVGTALLLFLVLALFLTIDKTASPRSRYLPEQLVLWVGLAGVPAAISAVFVLRHLVLGERYFLVGALGLSICSIAFFSYRFDSAAIGALAASVFLCCLPVALHRDAKLQIIGIKAGFVPAGTTLKRLDPESGELPVVLAHGDTFIDMNHREQPTFVARTFFLLGREDAIRYRRFTLFEEEFSQADGKFPLLGHVMNYRDFVALYPHFILIGTAPDNPTDFEEWIEPRLIEDGAEIRFLGESTGSYSDSILYDVVMHPKP